MVLNRTAFPLVESHKCLWMNYFNNALHLYTLHLYLSTPLLTVWRIRAGYPIILFYGRGDGFSLQVPDGNQGLGLVSGTLAAVVCCEVMGKSTASLSFPLLFLSGKYWLPLVKGGADLVLSVVPFFSSYCINMVRANKMILSTQLPAEGLSQQGSWRDVDDRRG